MIKPLEIQKLRKVYPTFTLDNISFSLEPGKITGFIGRNGAGKSTTLNALFNFVNPDAGRVLFWGEDVNTKECEIKQKVGFVSSGVNYYPTKKLKKITTITKMFYHNWDEDAYNRYMHLFKLDENKTPKQLSVGMKIKYALVLALSHKAELLILDEPTSGLDPVSREELLDIFINLSEEGKTILFSTHITSDLEKCADQIVYIKNGQIKADKSIKVFVEEYKLVSFDKEEMSEVQKDLLIGAKKAKTGMTALVSSKRMNELSKSWAVSEATLDDIMIHMEVE
ncbi:MAG: ABC transporter ATP-binding protein [Cellulosilyticum sp.]|nr:ABC transporter ATP-binding protein [Cellulosilyticum sp.]